MQRAGRCDIGGGATEHFSASPRRRAIACLAWDPPAPTNVLQTRTTWRERIAAKSAERLRRSGSKLIQINAAQVSKPTRIRNVFPDFRLCFSVRLRWHLGRTLSAHMTTSPAHRGARAPTTMSLTTGEHPPGRRAAPYGRIRRTAKSELAREQTLDRPSGSSGLVVPPPGTPLTSIAWGGALSSK